MPETIAIGADHAGFQLKESLKQSLALQGLAVMDVGCENTDRCDYPDYAAQVAQLVLKQHVKWGVLCCGSGVGMAITANRYVGVRAVVCHDLYITEMSRRHNNANVICFGGRIVAPEYAADLLDTFFKTPFEGGRHEGRVKKMDTIGEPA